MTAKAMDVTITIPELPDDMQDAYDSLRLAIMHAQRDGYQHVTKDDVLTMLGMLCDLVIFGGRGTTHADQSGNVSSLNLRPRNSDRVGCLKNDGGRGPHDFSTLDGAGQVVCRKCRLREDAYIQPPGNVAAVGEANDKADYWLAHMLAEYVVRHNEGCELESMTDFTERQLCVTEYCAPCAARWWLDEQAKLASQPAPSSEVAGDEVGR